MMPEYPKTKDYDETGYAPPLEPGAYKVVLIEINEEDAKGGAYTDSEGYRYSLFVFDVEGHSGNRLFDRVCFDPAHPYKNLQLGRFKQMLSALGGDPEKEGHTDDLLKRRCMVDVVRKTLPSKTVNNIDRYYSSNESEPKGNSGEAQTKDDDDSLPF